MGDGGTMPRDGKGLGEMAVNDGVDIVVELVLVMLALSGERA